jgi:hypothetical protein
MPDHEEKVTLDDVGKDGDVLLLVDGRRLLVNPKDAAVTSIWERLAPLTLRERRGGRAAFGLTVTNEETGDTVAAKLDDDQR